MTARISTAAFVLALIAAGTVLPGSVLAQTAPLPDSRSFAPGGAAAATLPNSFDAPAAALRAPPAATASPTTEPSAVQLAEVALRSVIVQIQAGDIDESLYTADLARQLNAQLAEYTPLVVGYGTLLEIEPQGGPDGVGQFVVTFDNAATQWRIGIEQSGRIAALLFRPAPPESSEPVTPAAD